MRVCLLNSVTKQVINVVSLDKPEDHNPTPGIEVAPHHDGDMGWVWNGSGWNKPEEPQPTLEELIEINRRIRDKWLRRHIDTMSPIRWNVLTEEQKNAWTQYRQALLDVPQQPGFPYNIIWPQRP